MLVLVPAVVSPVVVAIYVPAVFVGIIVALIGSIWYIYREK